MTAKKVWAMAEDTSQFDSVTHPEHYCSGDVECIDAMVSAFGVEAVENYCQGNAFKYLWRASRKGGNEDMRKCRWYIDKYLELSEK